MNKANKLKKIINKLFYKLGYVKPNPFGELLEAVVKESLRRNETVTLSEMGLEIEIKVKEKFS